MVLSSAQSEIKNNNIIITKFHCFLQSKACSFSCRVFHFGRTLIIARKKRNNTTIIMLSFHAYSSYHYFIYFLSARITMHSPLAICISSSYNVLLNAHMKFIENVNKYNIFALRSREFFFSFLLLFVTNAK